MKKLSFQYLVSLARQETPPAVDVADTVIATLSGITQRVVVDPYRPYLWMGLSSAAVAACILVAATFILQSGNDAVSDMMSYVSWVTQ